MDMDVNQTEDFVNDIEFNDIKTESKEGIVKIKMEKIESPEVKEEGKRAKTDLKKAVDFVKDIEFNDIKTKTETKEGIVKIKKEKIESPEVKQDGKRAKTDFKKKQWIL